MKHFWVLTVILALLVPSMAFAGGWDKSKGLDMVTIKGDLVCVGCSLKKMSGANAQCDLFAHHAIGFRTGDGLLWNFVDNAKGHDIIRGHTLLEGGKKATIKGYLYPVANMIEIVSITVDGVSMSRIQKAAWEEDRLIAKSLMSRKVGEAPIVRDSH